MENMTKTTVLAESSDFFGFDISLDSLCSLAVFRHVSGQFCPFLPYLTIFALLSFPFTLLIILLFCAAIY